MTIPTTYLSLHDVTGLKAVALTTMDTPLVLTIDSQHGSMQISIYTGRDGATVERLADAINDVLKQPSAPPAFCPLEDAAYKAQSAYHYRGATR